MFFFVFFFLFFFCFCFIGFVCVCVCGGGESNFHNGVPQEAQRIGSIIGAHSWHRACLSVPSPIQGERSFLFKECF